MFQRIDKKSLFELLASSPGESLEDKVRSHRLGPVLYQEYGVDLFREDFLFNTCRNQGILEQIVELLDQVDGKCEVLVLKGGDLAFHVYSPPGLRPMSDVDFLVQPLDLPVVTKALIDLGYRARKEPYLNTYQQRFLRDEDDALVELHWALASPYSNFDLDTAKLFERSTRASYLGRTARVLGRDDLPLYLAFHIVKHRFYLHLLALWDFVVLVERFGVPDWKSLRKRAQEVGFSDGFELVLGTLDMVGLPSSSATDDALQGEAIYRLLDTSRQGKTREPLVELRKVPLPQAIYRALFNKPAELPKRMLGAIRRLPYLLSKSARKSFDSAYRFDKALGTVSNSQWDLLFLQFEARITLFASLALPFLRSDKAAQGKCPTGTLQIQQILWAITDACLSLPIEISAKCWSVSAFWMMRRRGFSTTIRFEPEVRLTVDDQEVRPWLGLTYR